MSFTFDSIINTLAHKPQYKVEQALKAVYQQAASSWDEVTVLSKKTREELEQECPLNILAELQTSQDKKTWKAAFAFKGDIVEAVLMRHENRDTVCVSSQVGCALQCDFCLTGRMGFRRDLTMDEILKQVLFFNRLLKKENKRVDNIVFMGMGEPFLNYINLLAAIKKLNDPDLFGIGSRRISVSTAGIVPGIKKFSQEPYQANLSVSVHAPNDDLRRRIMPIDKTYPLDELLKAVRKYITKTKRRVMIEYVVLEGVNDKTEHAQALVKILQTELKELYFINLIRYNATGRYKSSSPEAIKKFKVILEKAKITVVERYRFGDDVKAACGQLAGAKRF